KNTKPRDVNMQYRGPAYIKRRKSAIDRGSECVRLGDAFAMRAEGFCDVRKIPPVALPSRHQPRLELVGLGRDALWIDALHGGFDRLPAAIVQYDGEYRNLVLLRHRIDAVRRGEMKAAVADHLYDAAGGLRQ